MKEQVGYYLKCIKIILDDCIKLGEEDFVGMDELKECIEHGETIESRHLQGVYDARVHHDVFSKR